MAANGEFYGPEVATQEIRKLDSTGHMVAIAGGFAGRGLARDPAGNLYVADSDNHIVRRIDGDTITTVAGIPESPGYSGDMMDATSAELQGPVGVAVDAMGRVIIADALNNRVRRVELDGTIVTIAGNGDFGYNGDNIAATSAELAAPLGVAVDPQGRVVITDAFNRRIRRVELNATIVTIAGTGVDGFSGDGGPATNATMGPWGVAVDRLDDLRVLESLQRKRDQLPHGRRVFDDQKVRVLHPHWCLTSP